MALCYADGAGIQHRPQFILALTDFVLQPYVALVCCLMIYLFTNLGDGRLSCPSWLTHSGQFPHEVVTCQPWFGRRSGKVR